MSKHKGYAYTAGWKARREIQASFELSALDIGSSLVSSDLSKKTG